MVLLGVRSTVMQPKDLNNIQY